MSLFCKKSLGFINFNLLFDLLKSQYVLDCMISDWADLISKFIMLYIPIIGIEPIYKSNKYPLSFGGFSLLDRIPVGTPPGSMD